jgi:hypothetical protein
VTEQPLIASFVVRLLRVEETRPGPNGPPLRVLVRHVQTGQEMRCLRLEDAMAFMEHCLQLPRKAESE